MRGGRNKFGPMYKRDRARKLQMMRQRQMAVQTLRNSGYGGGNLGDGVNLGYAPVSNFIKQEIQIPQVSSLTSSPDSSPSPIAVALGQVSGSSGGNLCSLPSSGNHHNSGGNHHHPHTVQVFSEAKLWPTSSPPPPPPPANASAIKAFGYESSTTTPATSTSANPSANKLSPMIRDFVQGVDDAEWQNSLYGLLQNQTYNQCEVDLFELMCKVLDQNLFSQVDWARNSIFFKDLK
ncbi:unnamed protein product, partial [Nesidiocoris tenuis]